MARFAELENTRALWLNVRPVFWHTRPASDHRRRPENIPEWE